MISQASNLCRRASLVGLNKVNHVRNHVPMRFPAGSYDDLEVPQGSWEESYKRRNGFYNMFFAGSSIFMGLCLSLSIFAMDLRRFDLTEMSNTEEGLKFLKPDPEALDYVLKN